MTKSVEIKVTREDAKACLAEMLQDAERIKREYELAGEDAKAKKKIQTEYMRQIHRLLSIAKEDSGIGRELMRMDALFQAETIHNTHLFENYFSYGDKTEILERRLLRMLQTAAAAGLSAKRALFHFYKAVEYDNGLGVFRTVPVLMPSSNYASALSALQKACLEEITCPHPTFTLDNGGNIYRPLTFKETMGAVVDCYKTETHHTRKRLFTESISSCTGIAYKAGTTKFKIIPRCRELITLPDSFNNKTLKVNYNEIKEAREFDQDTCNTCSTRQRSEVISNDVWLAAVEGDTALLSAYCDIVFAEIETDKTMGIWLKSRIDKDILLALQLEAGSFQVMHGYYDLNGQFLRLTKRLDGVDVGK